MVIGVVFCCICCYCGWKHCPHENPCKGCSYADFADDMSRNRQISFADIFTTSSSRQVSTANRRTTSTSRLGNNVRRTRREIIGIQQPTLRVIEVEIPNQPPLSHSNTNNIEPPPSYPSNDPPPPYSEVTL